MAEKFETEKKTEAGVDVKRDRLLGYIKDRMAESRAILDIPATINIAMSLSAKNNDLLKALVAIQRQKDMPSLIAIRMEDGTRVPLDKNGLEYLAYCLSGVSEPPISSQIHKDVLDDLRKIAKEIKKHGKLILECRTRLIVQPSIAAETKSLAPEAKKAYDREQPFIVLAYARELSGRFKGGLINPGTPAKVLPEKSDEPWRGKIDGKQAKALSEQVDILAAKFLEQGLPEAIVVSKPYSCVGLINKALKNAGYRQLSGNVGNSLKPAVENGSAIIMTAEELGNQKGAAFSKAKNGDVVLYLKCLGTKKSAEEYERRTGDPVIWKNNLPYHVEHVTAYMKDKSGKNRLLQAHIANGNIVAEDADEYSKKLQPYQIGVDRFNAVAVLPLSALGSVTPFLASTPKPNKKM